MPNTLHSKAIHYSTLFLEKEIADIEKTLIDIGPVTEERILDLLRQRKSELESDLKTFRSLADEGGNLFD